MLFQSTTFGSQTLQLFACLLMSLIACSSCATAAFRDDAATSPPPLEITINEIQIVNQTGLEAISGQVMLKLRVENKSDQPIRLETRQFQFSCNGQLQTCHSSTRSPLVGVPRSIETGESIEGYLGLSLAYPKPDEPPMELIWELNEGRVVTSINQAIRQTTNLETRLVGPDECLAVVTIQRPVDNFSAWLLTEEFKRLRQAGLRRVVLATNKADSSQMSFQTRTSVSAWLSSVKEGFTPVRVVLANPVKSQVQFSEFFVAGMGVQDPSGFLTGASGIYKSDVEKAVASALQTIYEAIPLDRATADIESKEPGVARAAIEANIDRMSDSILDSLIKQTESRPAAFQALIAENLYRVTSPLAVSALSTLVRSQHKEVSQAALRSLVKSVSPNAATALKDVWHESSDFALHQDIVSAVMSSKDYRHADLLEQYARTLIADSSQPEDAEDATSETDADDSDAFEPQMNVEFGNRTSSVSVPQTPKARTLKSVLDFLKELDSSGVVDVAKSQLLNIADPGIQDVVLEFLLNSNVDGDVNGVAHDYINMRLKRDEANSEGLTTQQKAKLDQNYGPKGTTRNLRITMTLMTTIRRFPDSTYTERLLELAEDQNISSTMRRTAFQVGAKCATDHQLNELIGRFETLDRYGKEYLLKSMSQLNHPQWLGLTKKCMNMDESTQGLAIGSLVSNGSAEAMMVIVNRLSELLETAAENADAQQVVVDDDRPSESGEKLPRSFIPNSNRSAQLEPSMLRPIEKLINSLRECSLPEARRVLNRCERSPIIKINEVAVSLAINSYRSDPNAMNLTAAARLRLSKQYEAALKAYDEILIADPFCSMAYSARSSMHSRLGSPQAAIDDLQRALELEPEDALIESLIALAEVEIGRTEKGIQMMEDTLKSIPDLPTLVRRDALYNLGCAYGRALDNEKDEKLRAKYTNRGMEVLRNCVERQNGWDDPDHVENDPDVDAFRNHPDWAELMEKMRQNERDGRGRP